MAKGNPQLFITLFLDLLGWGNMVLRYDDVNPANVPDKETIKALAKLILQHRSRER